MADPLKNQTLAMQFDRNRIIEALECASSFEEQRLNQEGVPDLCISRWVLTEYQDRAKKPFSKRFEAPVFTEEELAAMERFERVWDQVWEWFPDPEPPLTELYDKPEWQLLADAAKEAFDIFMKRGKMSDTVAGAPAEPFPGR